MEIGVAAGRGTSIRRKLAKSLLAVVVVIVAAEGLLKGTYAVRNAFVTDVPLPYLAGHTYAALPPWYDGLRILKSDRHLIWKTRPNIHRRYVDVFSPVEREEDRVTIARRFFPSMPPWMAELPSWEISLNSSGFRDNDFTTAKPDGVVRVLCLGDSWTFGANVDQHKTYPYQLEELLQAKYPETRIEVLNLGVMGYSSTQGSVQLKRIGLELDPDIIVLGFAMNDGQISGWRDADMMSFSRSIGARLYRALRQSEILKLSRYVSALMFESYKPLDIRVAAEAQRVEQARTMQTEQEFTNWTRVSPSDYEQNLRLMIEFARASDASVVLLFNELLGNAGVAPQLEERYIDVLERLAEAGDVGLVDTSALMLRASRELETELERRFDLRTANRESPGSGKLANGIASNGVTTHEENDRVDTVDVVFRIYANDYDVDEAIFVSGNHPHLGDIEPNRIALHDDGSHGDEVAGDSVWSLSVPLPAGETLFYVYTNSGTQGEWEGVDVPYVRSLTVETSPAPGPVYRPIESFGTIYMQTDGWHTNDAGYSLIANRVLEEIAELPGLSTKLVSNTN